MSSPRLGEAPGDVWFRLTAIQTDRIRALMISSTQLNLPYVCSPQCWSLWPHRSQHTGNARTYANPKPVTLKSIQTDRAATFYADKSPDCAWFVELVLPTDGKLAASRPSPDCAWFVELVLPTGESKLMAENLQSVAATL